MSELEIALSQTKKNKFPGLDIMLPEFLIFSGPNICRYLVKIFNVILETGDLPKLLRVTKPHAIREPGKDGRDAADYRPISLFSSSYKLLERRINNRMSQAIDTILTEIQAGFRNINYDVKKLRVSQRLQDSKCVLKLALYLLICH